MPNLAGLVYYVEANGVRTKNDLLTRDEILDMLKCGRSSLYVLMDEQGFPRPIKLATHTNRWLGTEVDVWLDRRAAARDVRDAA